MGAQEHIIRRVDLAGHMEEGVSMLAGIASDTEAELGALPHPLVHARLELLDGQELQLFVPNSVATELAIRALGDQDIECEDGLVEDCVGELCNLIGGAVFIELSSRCGLKGSMGYPSVERNDEEAEPEYLVRILTDVGPIGAFIDVGGDAPDKVEVEQENCLRLEALAVEALPYGVALVDAIADQVIWCNPEFRALTGARSTTPSVASIAPVLGTPS